MLPYCALMAAPQPVTVTDFRGDAAQAAAFVSLCWDAQFPNTVSCSQWGESDFAWQIFAQEENIILGAYDGDTLVGFVYGEPIDVLWCDRPERAMFSSALAVDPDRKGEGIAKMLAQTLARRMQQGSRVAFSVTKRIANQAFDTDANGLVEMEAAGQAICLTSGYHADAVGRFVEKQPLKFNWEAA